MTPQVPTPTPEEIRERCAAIQAEWTEREEMSRRGVREVARVEIRRMAVRAPGKGDPAEKFGKD